MSYVDWCNKHQDDYKGDECWRCRAELDAELASLKAERDQLQEANANLNEDRRDTAKGHQADARIWQAEKYKLQKQLKEVLKIAMRQTESDATLTYFRNVLKGLEE